MKPDLQERLIDYLAENGLAQKDFASVAGVSPASISRLVSGSGAGAKVSARVEAALCGVPVHVDTIHRDQKRQLFRDFARDTWCAEFAPFEERVKMRVGVLEREAMTRHKDNQAALKAIETRLDLGSAHRDDLRVLVTELQNETIKDHRNLNDEHMRVSVAILIGALWMVAITLCVAFS